MPIASFNDLTAAARRTVLDGFVTGKPIGDSVSRIILMASTFGANEARSGNTVGATIDLTGLATFEDVLEETTGMVIERLFDGSKLKSVVTEICQMGTAFGYQNVKRQEAERKRFERLNLGPVTEALEGVKAEAKTPSGITAQSMEAFFALALEIPQKGDGLEVIVGLAKEAMTAGKLPIMTGDSYKKFVQLFSNVIVRNES